MRLIFFLLVFGCTAGYGQNRTLKSNSSDGQDGNDGLSFLFLIDNTVGANCTNGGLRIRHGLDNGDGVGTAANGTLEIDEVDATDYVCNGVAGTDDQSIGLAGGVLFIENHGTGIDLNTVFSEDPNNSFALLYDDAGTIGDSIIFEGLPCTVDLLNLNGTTLELSLTDDGVAPHEVDLSSIGSAAPGDLVDIALFTGFVTDPSWAKAQSYIDRGRVYLQGNIFAATGNIGTQLIGTLPAGHHPSRNMAFVVTPSTSSGASWVQYRINISTAGHINAHPFGGAGGTNTGVSLEGISFRL